MIEPLVTTLLVPVCSCMCGIYPSFSFFLRRHRLLSPAVCGTNYANPYQHMFPVPQGRDFLSKSTRSAISGLYAFRFYSFSADMDRVGFDKVQVLTFLAVLWSWAIRSTINIFFRLLGYLRLPLRITRKVSSKHSYQPQIQSTLSLRGWRANRLLYNKPWTFQSTPSRRGWQYPGLNCVLSQQFQSTPSRGGWRKKFSVTAYAREISIHTLAWRVTRAAAAGDVAVQISIHTLAWRVTGSWITSISRSTDFNPHPRVEGDRYAPGH